MHCIGSVVGVLCVCRVERSSGTNFWMVWLVIAIILILLAICIATDWWPNVPRLVQNVIIALIFIGIVAFGTVEGCIISRMDEHADPNLDYVVVLGAQVRKSGPSKVLRYRLDTAIDYLNENPGTICIVSGGKGPNEPVAEAQGMTNYLESYGIKKNRIIKEMKSKTTQEKHLEQSCSDYKARCHGRHRDQ